MPRILSGNWRGKAESYDLWRLVNYRKIDEFSPGDCSVQVICDIDKTYLETEFESLVKIAKIALEKAPDKITVAGARDLLLALRWGDIDAPQSEGSPFPRPLHFVSSSPPQLRPVLEEKLIIDGLDWSSDTFKDQAYNIRKGRFDLLKHQVTYKTAAIFKLISDQPSGSSFYMIGDSAESDAYIYLGVRLFLEGALSLNGYREFLGYAGVEPDTADQLIHSIPKMQGYCVKGILIRKLNNYRMPFLSPLTDGIFLFQDYFDVVLFFALRGLISSREFRRLIEVFHNEHGIPLAQLKNKITWYKENTDMGSEYGAEFLNYLQKASFPLQQNFDPEWPEHGVLQLNPGLTEKNESEVLALCQNWSQNLQKNRKLNS